MVVLVVRRRGCRVRGWNGDLIDKGGFNYLGMRLKSWGSKVFRKVISDHLFRGRNHGKGKVRGGRGRRKG